MVSPVFFPRIEFRVVADLCMLLHHDLLPQALTPQ
jgi:hypothetical protein